MQGRDLDPLFHVFINHLTRKLNQFLQEYINFAYLCDQFIELFLTLILKVLLNKKLSKNDTQALHIAASIQIYNARKLFDRQILFDSQEHANSKISNEHLVLCIQNDRLHRKVTMHNKTC